MYQRLSIKLLSRVYFGQTYPSALPQAVQTKLVSDLSRVHGIGQILLVGEDEQESIPQLVLVQHALQLLAGLDDTVTVVAVDDEDDALGVLEVMPPQRPDLVLPAHVPHGELDVLVLDGLDVEPWDGVVSMLERVFVDRLAPVHGDNETHRLWEWW